MELNNISIKRKVNYFWEGILMQISKPIVSLLLKTRITPNIITFFNLLFIIPLLIFYLWKKNFIVVAILIQCYAIVDILDGTIARNKNMTSEFGRKLDCFCDDCFYFFVYGFICYMSNLGLLFSIVFVLVVKIYGIIATKYIVKEMKKNEDFKHTKIKQFFRNHFLIFGMDVSMQNLITSIALVFGFSHISFYFIVAMWILDMIYRIYEVTIYQRQRRNCL